MLGVGRGFGMGRTPAARSATTAAHAVARCESLRRACAGGCAY